MTNRVGWFEVVGQDGEKLRSFYGDVFGWQFNVPSPEMNYGMTDDSQTGIGGGNRHAHGGPRHAAVFVGVSDPPAAPHQIQKAGGQAAVPATRDGKGNLAQVPDPASPP